MYGDLLFGSSNAVATSPFLDIPKLDAPWRAFAFGEMAHGNLPHWKSAYPVRRAFLWVVVSRRFDLRSVSLERRVQLDIALTPLPCCRVDVCLVPPARA